MISPDRALKLVLKHIPRPLATDCPVRRALGRVLAESIEAPDDFPHFVRAMMDGFAIALADAGRRAEVADVVAAGYQTDVSVAPGRCVEIMTGAPCPPGTEAVVAVEKTRREGNFVFLPEKVKAGQHMQPVGDLCRKGTVTLEPGAPITPLVIGHLTAFNRSDVKVFAAPRVAVISTGDELVPVGGALSGGQIRDSNGPMLMALAQEAGADSVKLLHARDTEVSLEATLKEAGDADIVVLTGGVSMGKFDLVPRVVEAMGATPIFHKVTQKPGKPLLFAANAERLFFGLPGNARSTHFCFTRYVAPALRRFIGRTPVLEQFEGRLTSSFRCKSERTLFIPMAAHAAVSGCWDLHPFDDRGSADIYTTARANVYARFEPGEHDLPVGTPLPFFFMGSSHG